MKLNHRMETVEDMNEGDLWFHNLEMDYLVSSHLYRITVSSS